MTTLNFYMISNPALLFSQQRNPASLYFLQRLLLLYKKIGLLGISEFLYSCLLSLSLFLLPLVSCLLFLLLFSLLLDFTVCLGPCCHDIWRYFTVSFFCFVISSLCPLMRATIAGLSQRNVLIDEVPAV